MAEVIHEMYSEEQVNARIRELGGQISADLAGEPVKVVCVLKGASFFACELAKRITSPVYMDFMYCSSYGDGTVSSGKVKITRDLEMPIEGENVLIAEDIIDSGHTLKFLTEEFRKRGAKRVMVCVMLSKPERREVEVPVDYVGFVVPDKFIVGYGLDYAQKYRNLPFIGTMEF
ncbi:MAG: hypoxanthine phosphoribosyltransferase [Clostridiales bacterium]|nr:hypoxanthine phosphoribosyltransferase [Clostridiales bacterium]